ncbi:hypothetical protein A374_16198 [Fictibacillus macauensis ZFHKF-1]|uniref:Uncharacterized protein n=1 Tax=Fictibacillus macauensis ZFHKF-1 TaxID=1196324 RepID=I8AG28_9BACL|nr:hypothetical protein [Fictibacillus macauensis]EIT84344.1 hypothetical protein A374_16198 [Fictibacillus macauensis ZFHKF-1]
MQSNRDWVIWQDGADQGGTMGIYAYNVHTGETHEVDPPRHSLEGLGRIVLAENYVVWTDPGEQKSKEVMYTYHLPSKKKETLARGDVYVLSERNGKVLYRTKHHLILYDPQRHSKKRWNVPKEAAEIFLLNEHQVLFTTETKANTALLWLYDLTTKAKTKFPIMVSTKELMIDGDDQVSILDDDAPILHRFKITSHMKLQHKKMKSDGEEILQQNNLFLQLKVDSKFKEQQLIVSKKDYVK